MTPQTTVVCLMNFPHTVMSVSIKKYVHTGFYVHVSFSQTGGEKNYAESCLYKLDVCTSWVHRTGM